MNKESSAKAAIQLQTYHQEATVCSLKEQNRLNRYMRLI